MLDEEEPAVIEDEEEESDKDDAALAFDERAEQKYLNNMTDKKRVSVII